MGSVHGSKGRAAAAWLAMRVCFVAHVGARPLWPNPTPSNCQELPPKSAEDDSNLCEARKIVARANQFLEKLAGHVMKVNGLLGLDTDGGPEKGTKGTTTVGIAKAHAFTRGAIQVRGLGGHSQALHNSWVEQIGIDGFHT